MGQPVIDSFVSGLPVWTLRLQDVDARLNGGRKLVGLSHAMAKCAVIVVAAISNHLSCLLFEKLMGGAHTGEESAVTSDSQDLVLGQNSP